MDGTLPAVQYRTRTILVLYFIRYGETTGRPPPVRTVHDVPYCYSYTAVPYVGTVDWASISGIEMLILVVLIAEAVSQQIHLLFGFICWISMACIGVATYAVLNPAPQLQCQHSHSHVGVDVVQTVRSVAWHLQPSFRLPLFNPTVCIPLVAGRQASCNVLLSPTWRSDGANETRIMRPFVIC